MAFSLRHLTALLLATLAIAKLSAQPAQPAPPQFRVVSMSDVETFLFDVEKKQETLYASIGAFSRLYPAPQSRELSFYKEDPNPNPALPPIKTPLAKARLPGDSPGPFLVVIHRTPQGFALPFETFVINHSLAEHPIDNYRVFNFSKRRLAVSLAETEIVLDQGQSRSVPYPDTRKAWLKVAADEQSGGWLLVNSGTHTVGAGTRTTIFLVDIAPSALDPNPRGIVARRIRESITTDEKGFQQIR